jgi:hypothetical protein
MLVMERANVFYTHCVRRHPLDNWLMFVHRVLHDLVLVVCVHNLYSPNSHTFYTRTHTHIHTFSLFSFLSVTHTLNLDLARASSLLCVTSPVPDPSSPVLHV